VATSYGTSKPAAKLKGGITAAVAFGDGFVLAGSENGGQHAVVWYSPDGVRWQPVDDAPGFADGVIANLVRLPDGLMAVGTAASLDAECAGGALGCNPVSPIRLWTSSDGRVWHALPSSAAKPFGRAQLDLIVAGPAGLVAYGQMVPAEGTAITPMVWTSADGRSWSRAPQFASAFSTYSMSDLDAGPSGYVAVGARSVGGSLTQPRRAWYSADGKTWKLGSGPAANGPSVVMAFAGGFFGVENPQARASFWVSADGVNWSVQPGVVDRPNYPAYVGSGLFSDGTRILALGSDSFGTAGAWLTSDGRSWQLAVLGGPEPSLETAVLGSVVGAFGSRGVIVTTATGSDGPGPIWTIWLGTIGP
jgi:hypothetical protein